MIKGVNKQVLEVTNTENPYFERIVFFVKPEYQSGHAEKLKKEAQLYAARAKNRQGQEELAGKSGISSVRGFYARVQAWQ